jgi:two-component system, OmpR family, sensor kinase
LLSSHSRLTPRFRRPQLRTQVLAGVLLITLAALTVFDITAVTELRRHLLNRTDANLRSVIQLAQPVPAFIRTPGRRNEPPQPEQVPSTIKFAGPHIKLRPAFLDQYYLAFIPKEKSAKLLIEGNPDLVPNQVHALGAVRNWRVARSAISVRGNVQLRLRARPFRGGLLLASTSMGDVNKTVGRLRLILIIGSVGAALLVAFGVVLLLRRGLRPIEVMASEADRISAGDLTDRSAARIRAAR